MSELYISLDKEGTKLIDSIQWNEGLIIELADGSKYYKPNLAKSNSTISTSFYLVNITGNRFGIKELKFPDERVKVQISSPWIVPYESVMITLTFDVPSNPTRNDVIKSSELIINGFFIIE